MSPIKSLDHSNKGKICDNCNIEMTEVFKDVTSIQPNDALEIVFNPYYGGYFDQSGPERTEESRLYRTFWFCKPCADNLLTAFPVFKKIMKPFG